MSCYAIYRTFYGEDFIRQSIESIWDHVEKVFIFWSDRPWANVRDVPYKGEVVTIPWKEGRPFDGWRDRIQPLMEERPGVIEVIYDHTGGSGNQFTHFVNNRILPNYPKPDEILALENDYVFARAEIKKAFDQFHSDGMAIGKVHQVELWRTFDWACTPRPWRATAYLWDMRRLDALPNTGAATADPWPRTEVMLEATAHNVGFCASEKTAYWKHIISLGYSGVIGDSLPAEAWYEDVWKAWKPGDRNLEMSVGAEHHILEATPYPRENLPELLQTVGVGDG